MSFKYIIIFPAVSILASLSSDAGAAGREVPPLAVVGTPAVLHDRPEARPRHASPARRIVPMGQQAFAAPVVGAARALNPAPAAVGGAAAPLVHGAPPVAAMVGGPPVAVMPAIAEREAPVPMGGGAMPPAAGGGAVRPARPGAANAQRYYAAARARRAMYHGSSGSVGGSSEEGASDRSTTGGTEGEG